MRIVPLFRWLASVNLLGFVLLLGGVSVNAWAQTVVTTVPVGFIRVQVAGATDAVTPSLTAVSVPFYGAATYAGVLTSVDGAQTVSATGAGWAANQFVAPPTYFRLKSGVSTGRFFLVSANTASQLTLNTVGGALVSTTAGANQVQVQVGDKFELVPANSLGAVFGTTSVPFGTGATAAVADNLLLFNGSDWKVYFHNGTQWTAAVGGGNQNETVIPPDSAIFILRRSTTAISVYLAGTVPSTSEVAVLPTAASRFLSNRFPTDTTLLGLGVHASPNWRSGASAAQADNLLLWNGATWESFYYNGGQWRRSGSLLNFNSQAVLAGSGVFVLRKSGGTGDTVVSFPLPYTF